MSEQQQDQAGSGIGGGWLGTYAYRGLQRGRPPMRFEATFTESGNLGRFTGTILDDGGNGEADVAGVQAGPGVRFSKTYRRAGHETIEYEGTFSDEGQTMQGTWRIGRAAHGVWDARRLWSGNDTEAVVAESQAQEAAQPREVVRAA